MKRGIEYLERAAKLSSLSAAYNLGFLFKTGTSGVPKNLQKCIEWHRKAAERGYAASQFEMYLAYTPPDGNGEDFTGVLDPDPVEALRWLKLAAAQGHATATLRLGNALAFGSHLNNHHYVPVRVPPHAMCSGSDPTAAVRFYRAGAERGCSASAKSLGNMYLIGCDPEVCNRIYRGFGVSQSFKYACHWFMKAAFDGEDGQDTSRAGAMMALAWFWANGHHRFYNPAVLDGTPDPTAVAKLMDLAAELVHPKALKYKCLSSKDKAAVMAWPFPPGLFNHPLLK